MGIWEIVIIISLFILVLKPKEINFLIKNITKLIIKINIYTTSIKKNIIQLFLNK